MENTNNISYTLVDDDDFDQFSVTVIQGIDPHQTPYFSLLGGRSSCPLEEGTIYRDNPIMTVYDPATESTSGEGTAYFVEPNKPATFYIQVSNQNPFNEERPVDITLDPTTNLDGAKVTIAGTPMYYGQRVVMFLPADEPLVIPVSVERGLWAYDYENLRLDIKPYCGIVQADDGENTLLDESNKTVYLNVHFKNECSPISIAEPDGYWTILKQDPTNPNSREVLPIRLMDYEPSNEHLMNVHLEYRRKGSSLTWNPIPNAELSAEELGQWNSENFLASQVPYYVYSWDITGDYQTYPDGEYEIRAVAECGLSGHVYSNITKGAIERKTNLYSLPQPSDHVWTMGDEISVAFNLDIDCATVADSNFIVQKYGDNNRFLPGTVACANNKLIFSPELSLMPYFDGETLEMIVGGVHTANGNILDTVRWTFTVISRDIYVTKDTLEVELTQGQSATLSTMLVNNAGTGTSFNYRIKNVSAPINKTWLSCTDSTGTLIMGSPQKIDFTINSKTLAVGTKNLYLDITANGRTYDSAIYLKVKVLPATPNWVVNTSAYSDNMTVISNFYFDTNTSVKSTDTTDLISVWIGNEIRGVARISKFSATNYNAVIQVYGTSADASKALSFRVWDASAGIEYDARTTGTPTTIPFAINSIQGSVSSPKLLNILTASDKARYIPLNAGWTWFSGNTTNWNNAVNKSLASLRTPSNGDLLKTATKSATYSSTTSTWVPAASPANLDSTNVHRGYQIYLQKADTLRLTGAQPSISPISLAAGWNLIGVPSLTEVNTSSLTFSANPTSASLKTIPRDKNNYSPNMFATYAASAWTYTSESKMNKLYPNFAYLMNVNAATQLRYPGYVTTASPVALRTAQTPFDAYNATSWATNAPDYEHNMLITANLDYNKNEIAEEGSLVAAYVGDECRGVGRLSYVPELNKKYVSMFVYSNEANETIDFRIYDAKNDRYFDNFEPITFHTDSILGNFDTPYRFSNVAPDNSFTASVYPNPFSHKFTLNLKSDKGQTYQVQLSDIAGHVIQSVKLETESSDISHTIRTDALDLPSGVYILQVKGSLGETRAIKLVHNKD